jgi:hypothetical protein
LMDKIGEEEYVYDPEKPVRRWEKRWIAVG